MRKLFRCVPHLDPGVKGFLSPEARAVLDMSTHSCSWGSPSCIWKESPVQMRMCFCLIRCLTQTPGLQAYGYISYHSSPAWLSDVSICSHLICKVAVTFIHFLSMVSISIIMGQTKTPKLNAALSTEDDGAFFLQTLHHISWQHLSNFSISRQHPGTLKNADSNQSVSSLLLSEAAFLPSSQMMLTLLPLRPQLELGRSDKMLLVTCSAGREQGVTFSIGRAPLSQAVSSH